MRKRHLALGIILLALLLAAASSLAPSISRAEPALQGVQVQIVSPEMGAEVSGRVPLMGSASIPDFQFYKVEFGVGPNPAQWAVIGDLHYSPVVNGQLEVWDTAVLPDGVYTLQLQAVKRDGNWESFFVRGITLANTRPTSTPTSEFTETPETPEATATPAVTATPRATATLQIVAPTQALSMASPTPTLSRPRQRDTLPVDPENWGQAFAFGAISMGAVFVLLGIVFGIRRLL